MARPGRRLSTARTARHLQVLRAASLVEAEKHVLLETDRLGGGTLGPYVYLRALGHARLAEIHTGTRSFVEEHGSVERIADTELLRRVSSGEVTILDVRPIEALAAGHRPDARSMPLDEPRAGGLAGAR